MNWREMYPHYEKGWLETAGLVARPEKEVKKILETALGLGRDEARARWLLRATLYQYCGQTWGESLWYAQDPDDLFEPKDIIETMTLVARDGMEGIHGEVMERAWSMIATNIGEAGLYLAMVEDLLGSGAFAKLVAELKKAGVEFDEHEWMEIKAAYGGAVERAIFEWDDKTVCNIFLSEMVAMAGIEEKLNESAPDLSEAVRGRIRVAKTSARIGARELLAEIFARGLVTEGVDLNLGGDQMTYSEACQIWEEVKE